MGNRLVGSNPTPSATQSVSPARIISGSQKCDVSAYFAGILQALRDSNKYWPGIISPEDENNIADQTAQNSATINLLNTTYTVDAALTSPQDQRTFVLALASMDEHLGDDQEAIYELQTLTRLSSDATEISHLEGRIVALRRLVDIARENAGRHPVIHDSVGQTVLVRPRVTTDNEKVQP